MEKMADSIPKFLYPFCRFFRNFEYGAVITGIGVIAPGAATTEEFWCNCLDGKAALSPIPDHWSRYADFTSTIWAPLPHLDFTNDEIEAQVINDLFGKKPYVNATKSLIGHTIGAGGAIETAVTALSISRKTTHACKNLDGPIRDLNFVRSVGELPIRRAVTQSFAFGGHNAGLVLEEYR